MDTGGVLLRRRANVSVAVQNLEESKKRLNAALAEHDMRFVCLSVYVADAWN